MADLVLLKSVCAFLVFGALAFYAIWNVQFGPYLWRWLLLLSVCFFGLIYAFAMLLKYVIET